MFENFAMKNKIKRKYLLLLLISTSFNAQPIEIIKISEVRYNEQYKTNNSLRKRHSIQKIYCHHARKLGSRFSLILFSFIIAHYRVVFILISIDRTNIYWRTVLLLFSIEWRWSNCCVCRDEVRGTSNLNLKCGAVILKKMIIGERAEHTSGRSDH